MVRHDREVVSKLKKRPLPANSSDGVPAAKLIAPAPEVPAEGTPEYPLGEKLSRIRTGEEADAGIRDVIVPAPAIASPPTHCHQPTEFVTLTLAGPPDWVQVAPPFIVTTTLKVVDPDDWPVKYA